MANIFEQFDAPKTPSRNVFEQFDNDEMGSVVSERTPGVFESMGLPKFLDTFHDATTGVGQGLTFGFSDEINAGAAALLEATFGAATGGDSDLSEAYSKHSERLRGGVDSAKRRSPVATTVGEVTGGVALAPAAQGAASLMPRALAQLPNTVKFGGLGAATGGAYGVGTAQPGERAEGGLSGALIGAPVGVLAPHIAGGVHSAVRGIRNAVKPQSNVSADLGRALLRDEDTPQAIAQRFQQAQTDRAGVVSLADVGGENVRGLVERVAQTPGAGRTQIVPRLTARQQAQAQRIGNDLRQLTGTNRTALQATQQTMAERAKAAKPLYDEAFDFNARANPEIVRVWENVTGSGWGQAVVRSPAFRRALQTEYGIKDATDAPLMRVIDSWKKQVDDLVGNAVRNGRSNEARVLSGMRDRMLSVVDEANPAYARARNAWSGPSQYLDSIEAGRGVLSNKVSAEEFAATFSNLSASEQAAVREGAVSAIVGRMGNSSAKLGDMTRYLRSPEMRAKIATIMPDRAAAEAWARRLDFEVSASELTGRSLANSATARRLAEREDAQNIVGDLVMDALSSGASVSFLRRIVASGPRWLRDTLRSRADKILADVLTNPQRAADLPNVLSNVGNQGRPIGMAPRIAATVGGVSATAPR